MASDTSVRLTACVLALPNSDRGRAVPIDTANLIRRPHQNRLFDALSAAEYERLTAGASLVPMKLGDVLYEPDTKLRYVYFPTTVIISLLYVMEDGASVCAMKQGQSRDGVEVLMRWSRAPSESRRDGSANGADARPPPRRWHCRWPDRRRSSQVRPGRRGAPCLG